VLVEVDKCGAMPPAQFEAAKQKWRLAHDNFVKGTAATGVDGEKLIEEARSNLP